jgi:hypothetical protein
LTLSPRARRDRDASVWSVRRCGIRTSLRGARAFATLNVMAPQRTEAAERARDALTHWIRVRVVAGVLLTYLTVSFAIGDAYPFSTFAMYAESPREPWASHVLALDERGDAHDLADFTAYRCDRAPDLDRPFCGAGRDRRIGYIDAAAARTLATRAPTAAHPRHVRVVRRGWNLSSPGLTLDCALATCEATPR